MKKIDALDLDYHRNHKELKVVLNVDSIEEIDSQQYSYVTKLKEILKEIKSLLKEIKSIDDENLKNLSINTSKMGNKLKKVKQGKK